MINPNNAPLSRFTEVPGWETEAEQGVLYALASLLNTSSPKHPIREVGSLYQPQIVEIGSEFGMSASIFSKAAPDCRVFCVEMNPQALFTKNLREAGLGQNVEWIIGDSKTFEWKGEIDLLFVDGDHSFEGAKADLMKYTPHVVDGGFVCIHDCDCHTNEAVHPAHIEVRTAVQWWLAERGHTDGFQFMFSVDSLMVFQRIKNDAST